jgi:hypothetical protein
MRAEYPQPMVAGDGWGAIDHILVGELEASAIPTVDGPGSCRMGYAAFDCQVVQALEYARADADQEQLNRLLKWGLVIPALIFRRKKGGKPRNVSDRIRLWNDGEKMLLIQEWREEAQAYLKAQAARQPKKRTAQQTTGCGKGCSELPHRGKQGKALNKLMQNGVDELSDPRIEQQMETKHPQRAQVGVGAQKMDACVRVDLLPEHELMDLRLAIRKEDTDSSAGPNGMEAQRCTCSASRKCIRDVPKLTRPWSCGTPSTTTTSPGSCQAGTTGRRTR